MAASDTGTKGRRIDPDKFNDFLFDLSDYVKEDDFKRMKDLCHSCIPDGILEKLSEPYDLFKKLMEHGHISKDDTEQLQDLLHKAGRTDLKNKVVMFMQSKEGKQQDTPRAVEWLIKYLKNSYRTHFNKFQPLPWNDDFSLYMSEVYTRLQMVEVDERGKIRTEKGNRNDDFLLTLSEEVRSRLQMRGKIRTEKRSKTVSVEEVFESCGSTLIGKRIRIEGAPAIGKSMFCRKVAYEWSCGKLDQFKLVFLLELKRIDKVSIIDTIFDQLLPNDAKITKEELKKFLSENEQSVLFLFDGLDEMSDDMRESSDISKIIAKQLLSGCTAVVTSRPHECDSQLKGCDSHFKIQGFTKEGCKLFVSKYFNENEDTVKELMSFMDTNYISPKFRFDFNENSECMLRNPLHVAFICALWEDHQGGAPFPSTETELYTEILECILKRSCAKMKIRLNDGEIPSNIIDDVNELAKIAYTNFKDGKTFINEVEVPKPLLLLGLLVCDCGSSLTKPKKLCFFYHKTWLEYFSALHICNQVKASKSFDDFNYLLDDVSHYNQILLFTVCRLQENAGPVFEAMCHSVRKLGLGSNDSDLQEMSAQIRFIFDLLFQINDYKHFFPIIESSICKLSHIHFLGVSYRFHVCLDELYRIPVYKIRQNNICVCIKKPYYSNMMIDFFKYQHETHKQLEFENNVTLNVTEMTQSDLRYFTSTLDTGSISLECLTIVLEDSSRNNINLNILINCLAKTKAVQAVGLFCMEKIERHNNLLEKVMTNNFISYVTVSFLTFWASLKVSAGKQTEIHADRFCSLEDCFCQTVQCLCGLIRNTHLKCLNLYLNVDDNSNDLVAFKLLCENALNILEPDTPLEDLHIGLHVDSIPCLCKFIMANRQVKSLKCTLRCNLITDGLSSNLKTLLDALHSNSTLKSFTLEILGRVSSRRDSFQVAMASLLMPVYSSMKNNQILLESISYISLYNYRRADDLLSITGEFTHEHEHMCSSLIGRCIGNYPLRRVISYKKNHSIKSHDDC